MDLASGSISETKHGRDGSKSGTAFMGAKSIVDLPLAEVCEKTLITVTAWYDNEMGFSTQLARAAQTLASAVA